MLEFSFVLYSILGERIKVKREELNLSQAELAEKINLGRTSISNIEKGKQQTPLHIIYSICSKLNTDVQSILPTFSEIEEARQDKGKSSFDHYINTFDLSKNTLKQIKELIEKSKYDTKIH